MNGFREQLLGRVPAGTEVPPEIDALFAWIERMGFVTRGRADPDEVYGSLHGEGPDRPGTWLSVHADAPADAELLAVAITRSADGQDRPEAAAEFRRQVWPFARSTEGSLVALWRAPGGTARVVHLGSGSGSMLTCVLGAHPVDLLRLLAVGYGEICWPEEWDRPPANPVDDVFRDWVESAFAVGVPATGLEVVPRPVSMDEPDVEDTDDPFLRWLFDTGIFPTIKS